MIEAPFTGRLERDVQVPMRDGITLSVDIYYPLDTATPLPTLLAMSPYGKNAQRMILPAPVEARVTDLCAEAGWTNDIVDAGYIHVVADVRGSGSSGGTFYSMYSEQESQDGYDLVEWIAAQSWSDSNVGMLGISYFGTVQLVVAASRPPHLKAIAPLEATVDPYLACYHGGVLDGFYSELPHGGMTNNTGSGMDLADAKSWSLSYREDEELQDALDSALSNPDIRQYNMFRSILESPRRNTIFFDNLLNPYADSPMWWHPKLEDIEIPVLCGCAWYPDCGPKFVRGPGQIWERVKGPKKMIMAPAGWLERPFHQYHRDVLRWFDYWMKGIDNGVLDEAPVRLWLNGSGTEIEAEDWPLPNTEWTNFYLGTHRRLLNQPSRFEQIEPDGYVQPPPLSTRQLSEVIYSTGPQPQDLTVIGPVALHLFAGLNHDDGWFKATLLDILPRGQEVEISHGHLRATHQALDPERSRDWLPVHPHTRDSVVPSVKDEILEYSIEIYPIAHVFLKGHELAIRISSGDLPGLGFSFHLMPSRTITYTIYRDAQRPSRLVLPVIPREAGLMRRP